MKARSRNDEWRLRISGMPFRLDTSNRFLGPYFHIAEMGSARLTMCDHCEVLQKTLAALFGERPAGVIMRRVTRELHGELAPSKNEADQLDSE